VTIATRRLPLQLEQFLILSLLLSVGKMTAYVYLDWMEILLLLISAAAIEHGLLRVKHSAISYVSFSAFSTSLGVALMLASSGLWVYVFVVFLALGQKHFLSIEGKHFFNPSNFALMAAMVFLYSQAHIVTGQMGEVWWVEMLTIALAIVILVRASRWRIPIVFVLSYLFFQQTLVVGYDPMLLFEDVWKRFYSVSFLIFVAFMLTDPRTTPSSAWWQGVFGVAVALLAAGMDRWFGFRVQHLFMVLFGVSLWVPLIESGRLASQKMRLVTVFLFVVAIGAIIWIENQPPYYYEMSR